MESGIFGIFTIEKAKSIWYNKILVKSYIFVYQ